MSYFFTIISPTDAPLFTYPFGTSKSGGNGQSQFPQSTKHMLQFIVHSSLDIVEEIQWTTGAMYLKSIDRFYNAHISCFVTGAGVKFMLLHCPDPSAASFNPLSLAGAVGIGMPDGESEKRGKGRESKISSSSVAANPTSPAAEEAVRQFFADVYENWVKTTMNPFYTTGLPVTSPVFRARVAAAGRKYL